MPRCDQDTSEPVAGTSVARTYRHSEYRLWLLREFGKTAPIVPWKFLLVFALNKSNLTTLFYCRVEQMSRSLRLRYSPSAICHLLCAICSQLCVICSVFLRKYHERSFAQMNAGAFQFRHSSMERWNPGRHGRLRKHPCEPGCRPSMPA